MANLSVFCPRRFGFFGKARLMYGPTFHLVFVALVVSVTSAAFAGVPNRLRKSLDGGGQVTESSGDQAGLTLNRVVVIGKSEPELQGQVSLTPSYSGSGTSNGPASGSGANGPGPKDPAPPNTEKPASDKNTSPACSNPATGSPVVIATGEKYKSELDIVSGSEYALALSRTYRSFNTSATMFGPKWLSQYDYPALNYSGCYRHPDYGNLCIPTQVVFVMPDGSIYTYKRTSAYGGLGFRTNNSTALGTLVYDPYGGWTLYKDKLTYTFSTTGVIQRIASKGNATVLQFVYGADPYKPIRVVNNPGQTLEFTWLNGRVVKVKDPTGSEWNYSYNANGMLVSAASPGTAPDVRAYLYENSDPTLLTGITINGVRYSTYAYYADKRVQESGLAGGEKRDTFVYGPNQTTVTSAMGQPVTYTFAQVQGSLKVISVSRSSTPTCAAAAAETVYDANGWVDYTLDWSGNKTDYTYDATGRLLQVIRAAGTTSAISETNTWSGDDLVQTDFRDVTSAAYAKVVYAYIPSGLGIGKLASETWTDLKTNQVRTVSYAYTFSLANTIASFTVTRTSSNGTAATGYLYDTSGNLTGITNALGHQVTWSGYNGRGQPGRMLDANGVATDYVYGSNGNLLQAILQLPSGPRIIQYAYNGNR